MSPVYRQEDINILVLGDVNLDTLLVPLGEREWWRHRRPGGAWLLQEMIEAAKRGPTIEANGDKWRKNINVKTYREEDALDNNGILMSALENVEKEIRGRIIKSALDRQYRSGAAILGLFPKTAKPTSGDKDMVYRVERVLGGTHYDLENETGPYKPPVDTYKKSLQSCISRYTQGDSAKCDILVLHDMDKEFRKLDENTLESALGEQCKNDKMWIIWQMLSPQPKDDCWNISRLWRIIEKHGLLRQTILVLKAECLRRAAADLPDKTSLEEESERFERSIEAADPRSLLHMLSKKAGHLVVHFQRQGVLHYDSSKGCLDMSCYYCPDINGEPDSGELGTMLGYTTLLVAAIVRGITWSLIHTHDGIAEHMPEGIIDGIKQGVVLDHLYFLHGYGDGYGEHAILTNYSASPKPYEQLFTRFAALADKKSDWKDQWNNYSLAAVPRFIKNDNKWSRIEGFIRRWNATKFDNECKALENEINRSDIPDEERERLKENARQKRIEQAECVAREIVRYGLETVIDSDSVVPSDGKTSMPGTPFHKIGCPIEVHGQIKTAYRVEIEGFASIRRIIEKYLALGDWQSPLSIAVFGQPGSGKSFTVKQIMKSVSAEIAKRSLVYNMAEFEHAEDLQAVFHKVQDIAVTGEVPLVFFDEFDAREFYWLKHFLGPMQDGKFKAGEGTYRIGRAIFVFAGGVTKTWDEFSEPQNPKAFGNAKGPDFVSRLRGHLNIASINPKLSGDTFMGSPVVPPSRTGSEPNMQERVDQVLIFRRAILLRSLLEEHLKVIFDKNTKAARIDPDVVRAFLHVTRYTHEARSMEALIQMSLVSARKHFQMSSLPSRNQLNMHVSVKDLRLFGY